MPPAFILSQNQTLKFNCLKSLLFNSNNGSNFVISLLTLLKRYLFQVLLLIDGNYLSLACLSNKISFLSYSIFNLLFPSFSSALSPFCGESLSIIPQLKTVCQAFFQTFFNFFWKILKVLKNLSKFVLSRGQLAYNITFKKISQMFFATFLQKKSTFLNFFKKVDFSFILKLLR